MHIEIATEFSESLLSELNVLIPQLSRSSGPMSKDDLSEIIADRDATLIVARDESGTAAGMLTLIVFRIPTGIRAWIEDVVVDQSARGKSVGSYLVQRANEIATAKGAKSVDLTSRPDREAANRLYVREGFELRKTNVYRFSPNQVIGEG
ncbi:MAG: GNAT family N-acetyltransferase [Actinomycetota bacterium]|nr:GNAT family N-acetyltransferase [Actinomycetota bacterium]